jgi:hypothetical protein
MQQNQIPDLNRPDQSRPARIEQLLPLFFVFLVCAFLVVLIVQNREKIIPFFSQGRINNFDEMIVADAFHSIRLENGQSWKLTYEQSHDTVFSGLVRHTSPIKLTSFTILTRDILVTTGDFSNPDLVNTNVTNHHFTWSSKNGETPAGTLNLLHTVPMNEVINQKLNAIRFGDFVIIKGWEVDRIEGWDKNRVLVGYWQDVGCNTTLVTDVQILKNP